MKSKAIPAAVEMSYFRLFLLSYLRDSHPDKAADCEFIALRGDAAAEAYSAIIKSGGTHNEAEAAASEVLYAGLHFSPYNTLVNVLWNEFPDAVPPEAARQRALELLSRLAPVFEKYTLSDDFAGSPEYDLLYTELTGAVQILLEDGGL